MARLRADAKRPLLLTLSGLFAVVAGAQLLNAGAGLAMALSDREADDPMEAQGDAMPSGDPIGPYIVEAEPRTENGIDIVTEAGLVPDPATQLKADEYALKKEAERLRKQQASIDAAKAELADERRRRYRHLSAMYAQMPSAKAATILAKLQPKEAAQFVALMPGEAGAAILAAMPADAAVAITREVMSLVDQGSAQ